MALSEFEVDAHPSINHDKHIFISSFRPGIYNIPFRIYITQNSKNLMKSVDSDV